MDLSFHYLIMAEQAMFQKELLAQLKHLGLTIGQPKVLDYLQFHNGAEQKEIARGCHIEPGTLTSVLNRMEKNGLVERRMLNGNRRSFYIFLTAKGQQQAKDIHHTFQKLEEEVFSGISQAERTMFFETFMKIYHNTLQRKE